MSLRNVLFFDTMLTPKVITIVYWPRPDSGGR